MNTVGAKIELVAKNAAWEMIGNQSWERFWKTQTDVEVSRDNGISAETDATS